jgi:hypothetical protein
MAIADIAVTDTKPGVFVRFPKRKTCPLTCSRTTAMLATTISGDSSR